MSWNDFHNSGTALTKLLPLLNLIGRLFHLLPVNLCNTRKKESVPKEWEFSKWIAWLQRHVNMNPKRFNSFRLLQITKGPNKSTLQQVDGGSSWSLHRHPFCSFLFPKCQVSLSDLCIQHNNINLHVEESAHTIQNPDVWVFLSAIPL